MRLPASRLLVIIPRRRQALAIDFFSDVFLDTGHHIFQELKRIRSAFCAEFETYLFSNLSISFSCGKTRTTNHSGQSIFGPKGAHGKPRDVRATGGSR